MAGAGAWTVMAKANAVPIIGYDISGEIVGQYIYDGFIKLLWWGGSMKV